MRCPSAPVSPAGRASRPLAASRTDVTEVELTWIEARLEQWIRFGRVAGERIVSRSTKVVAFRPGAIFAVVRWMSNDYGTVHSSIAIVAATAAGAPYATLPFVRPGGDILLRIDGWPKVQRVLAAVDAVEAVGIDACDAAPEHWRHVGNRIAIGMPPRPYGRDRHAAWLRRRAIEA
ncbi:DUF2840 domain-containing protein [Sphingopyxis sp. YF1]|uniref:DUF2840 domain-containing protein n=1 Tax=Sphingopyxis sp. YF1 TaxID=2482763 RepID=UPI001F600323|nr:DUF2840 domain-containing protein [Sphingopyxis sp. YF1]UNU44489.1 DUF2840 domain-containing protein [Sphingopyxis sp. YF1]